MTANISLVGGETYDLRVYCRTSTLGVVHVDSGAINAVGYE
jgi:hypothetical protein